MAGIEASTRRVIAVITLMILAAWALRGYVPGSPQATERPERDGDNPVALAAVVVLVCAAVAIIGFAIVVRMRDRRPARVPAGALPRGAVTAGRPSWRFAIIALAAIIGWLVLVMLLSQVTDPGPVDAPPSDPPAASETDTAVPETDAQPAPEDYDDTSDTNVVDYLIPPMLILMALIVVGTAVASRRRRRDSVVPYAVDDLDAPPEVPGAATTLARAAEIGLAEIGDLSREPREAIIACYAAMERELQRVPGAVPLDCDTPSEVLARAVDSGALRVDSATELVELFEEARFSPHVMTEVHRDAAVHILHRVLAELPQRAGVG